MAANDSIVLNSILEQEKSKIARELPDDEFFELFTFEQTLKNTNFLMKIYNMAKLVAVMMEESMDSLLLLIKKFGTRIQKKKMILEEMH